MKKNGMFHKLPEELQNSIVITAIEQSLSTHLYNSVTLEAQMEEKREQEERDKTKVLEEESTKYIEAFKFCMMFESDACW